MSTTTARLAIMRAARAGRARLGLTQAELAARVEGWDTRHVSRVEQGEASVRAEELPGLCRALELPLRRLLEDLDPEDREAVGLPARNDFL